jgi:hypothetical protein
MGLWKDILGYLGFGINTTGYYKEKYSERYVDVKNKIRYDRDKNEYLDYGYFLEQYDGFSEISMVGFNKHHQNNVCDCALGAGKNIQRGGSYDVINEFRNFKFGCDIHLSIKYLDLPGSHYGFRIKNANYSYEYDISYYSKCYKRACVKCNKCLSDLPKLRQEFENALLGFEEYKKIEKICG